MGDIGSTLIYGSAGAYTTSVFATKDPELKAKKLKKLGITCATSTTTVVLQKINEQATLDRVHREYAAQYVESMSDDQIESALISLGLLEGDNAAQVENISKK